MSSLSEGMIGKHEGGKSTRGSKLLEEEGFKKPA